MEEDRIIFKVNNAKALFPNEITKLSREDVIRIIKENKHHLSNGERDNLISYSGNEIFIKRIGSSKIEIIDFEDSD